MIKDLNAVVANRAVAAPGRAVELAGDAPLHTHLGAVVRNIMNWVETVRTVG